MASEASIGPAMMTQAARAIRASLVFIGTAPCFIDNGIFNGKNGANREYYS